MSRDKNKYANTTWKSKGVNLAHCVLASSLEMLVPLNTCGWLLRLLASLVAEGDKALAQFEQSLLMLYTICTGLDHISYACACGATAVYEEVSASLAKSHGQHKAVPERRASARCLNKAVVNVLPYERPSGSVQRNQEDKRVRQEWLDLNDLIVEVVARLSAKNIYREIRLQLANVSPIFLADRAKLALALMVLLESLVNISPPHSEIGISSAVEGHVMHISMWKSADGAQACKSVGLADGGFALVRAIARMHNGLAWIEHWRNGRLLFHLTVRFVR